MEREWREIAIDSIDSGMVMRFGQAMLDSDKSIRSVNGYMDALSLLYRYHANSMPSLDNPSVPSRKALSADFDKTAAFGATNIGCRHSRNKRGTFTSKPAIMHEKLSTMP